MSGNVSFIFQNNGRTVVIDKKPVIIQNALDTTGAGDAFFSVIIKAYARLTTPKKQIDKEFINNVFTLANLYSSEIVQVIGSRSNKQIVRRWIEKCRTIHRENNLEL